MNKQAARCGGVVAQVIAAEVARTRCQGLVLASPPGPEGELLAQWLGQATRPWVLRKASWTEVAKVEQALQAYLEKGRPPDVAFAALGALGADVQAALDAAEVRRRGLLVPKLHAWTVGADLAR